jgi:hypothetical protein
MDVSCGGFMNISNTCSGIALSTLLTFNRLKALCDNPKSICTALSKSTSNLVEIEDNGVVVLHRFSLNFFFRRWEAANAPS